MPVTQWLGDAPVNATTPLFQGSPGITALQGGGYFVVWTDASNVAPDTSVLAVRGQFFAADGTANGPEFVVNTATAYAQQDPVTVALANGDVLVAWVDMSSSLVTGTGTNLVGRILHADGSSAPPQFVIADQLFDQVDPDVTALANGGFAVTWTTTNRTTDPPANIPNPPVSDSNINFRVFAYDGTVAAGGPVLTANVEARDMQFTSTITQLSDGRLAIAWTDLSDRLGNTPGDVRYRVFDGSGTPATLYDNILGLGGAYSIGPTGASSSYSLYSPDIVAMLDGGFYIGVTAEYLRDINGVLDNHTGVYGQRIDSNGIQATDRLHLNETTSLFQDQQKLIRLADGTMIAVWKDGSTGTCSGRIFTSTGAITSEFSFSGPAACIGLPDVAQLSDGRIVATWVGFDADGYGILQSIIDNRNGLITGTERGEWIEGSAANAAIIDDNISGFGGNDVIQAGNGNDLINGGTGNDIIRGGVGFDTVIYSSVGAPTVQFNAVSNAYTITGGTDGSDIVSGIENFQFNNGTFTAATVALSAANGLTGDSTANTLSGTAAMDTMQGLGGDDTLLGSWGADHMNGGLGNDTAYYFASTQGVTANLLTSLGSGGDAEGDSYASIENVIGSDTGNDMLSGGSEANFFAGNGGNDTLDGGAGGDSLFGGEGDDLLKPGAGFDYVVGGNGTDTADYSTSVAGVGVHMFFGGGFAGDATGDGITGIENVMGSLTGGDSLYGDGTANRLMGQGGDDTLFGSAGADLMDGGAGTSDTAYYFFSTGQITVSLAVGFGSGGDAEGDTIIDIENLIGSNNLAFGDVLTGNSNSNFINGYGGTDTIDGGQGNDTLYGGVNADTFRFSDQLFGFDVIGDWQDGSDRISLAATAVGAASMADVALTQVNATTWYAAIGISGTQGITVVSATPFTLDASDFLFR
jgi:Ca2+-binding RTX toxin-like protein